jgi:hypothetical protein
VLPVQVLVEHTAHRNAARRGLDETAAVLDKQRPSANEPPYTIA